MCKVPSSISRFFHKQRYILFFIAANKITKRIINFVTKSQKYNNGIDRKKALQIYQQFVDGYNLTSEQEQYLKNILDYVSMNGDIETKNFMEYPLKQYNWRIIFGDHFVNLKDFIKQIHGVISA